MPKKTTRLIAGAMVLGLSINLSFASLTLAAFNDVTMTTSAVVSVGGASLNISGSSAAIQSIVVGASSFDVTILSGSSFTVSSAAANGFTTSVSGVAPTITISCATPSTLTLVPAGTATVTVTPTGSCVTPAVTPVVVQAGSVGPLGGNFTFGPVVISRRQVVYPDGRIVYVDDGAVRATTTQAINTTVVAGSPVTYSRVLVVGKKGKDVEALQSFLEKKGFLVMPRGIARGYFGIGTKKALIKYQKSIGVQASGIFGPKTQAKVTTEK